MTRKRPITSSTEGTEEPGKEGRWGVPEMDIKTPPSPLGGLPRRPFHQCFPDKGGSHFSQPRCSLKGSSSPGGPRPVGGGLCRGRKGACLHTQPDRTLSPPGIPGLGLQELTTPHKEGPPTEQGSHKRRSGCVLQALD